MSKGRNRYNRARPTKTPHESIRILVEGSVTETLYFKDLRVRFGLSGDLVGVEAPGHTDPIGLVEDAYEQKRQDVRDAKREGRAPVEEWWVVVDVESAHDDARRQSMAKAIVKAREHGINLCLSAPSIEFWLLLHFRYTTRDYDTADEVISELKGFMPTYDSSNKYPDGQSLWERLEAALGNARKLRINHTDAGFNRPLTDCDILVCRLAQLAGRSDSKEFGDASHGASMRFVERDRRLRAAR